MSVQNRAGRGVDETLVISETEGGYRVYHPNTPRVSVIVSGIPNAPDCTCPDFRYSDTPGWACKHIQAVLDRFHGDNNGQDDPEPAEDQDTSRSNGASLPATRRRSPRQPSSGGTAMLLKRSVSPDGRIDSLSVEFSCSVEKLSEGEIRARAEKVLELQGQIVDRFRDRSDKEGDDEQPTRRAPNGNDPVPAKLLDIGGMNGKYGRRLFINVQVNGERIKLFGNRKQLAEAASKTGVEVLDREIEEGARLDVPCRVTTTPSPDGRYTNVDRVFPPNGPRSIGRAR